MNTIFGLQADTLLLILGILMVAIIGIVIFTAIRYPLAFRLGVRNIPRRKSQTALVVTGLALSTLIITSALGIGDIVDYSVKSEVYQDLGAIDQQISTNRIDTASGFSLGAAAPETDSQEGWFDSTTAEVVASLVDETTIDASVPVILQTLPVTNEKSGLSEAAVEIRGLGEIAGNGFMPILGLNDLASDQVIINKSLANMLDAQVNDNLQVINGLPVIVSVAEIVPDGELAGSSPAVITNIETTQRLFNQPARISSIFVSNAGDVEGGVTNNEVAVTSLNSASTGLIINSIKVDQLEAAASGAEFITTLFVTFGTFSILSGILLIFLIFSVLSAERKSELGMSRAVGLQRSDLVRLFVTEGMAYDFLAAALGSVLGVIAALLLAGTLSELLSSSALNITPRISPRSIAIGFMLGLVITFITVSISALRISKVNIIAAIRDLNLPLPPRIPQWTLFLRPFVVWRAAIQKAGEGQYREAARLFLYAGPKAIMNFWGGLFARGPVLISLGFLFAWVGVNVAGQAGVYGLGVSIFFIGLGQLVHWISVPARWAYSLTGLALILYWALPTRDVGALATLETNQGDFFISGMFLVGGAIVLFLYNADSLLSLFAGLLGRLGNLFPVARVAIAYPISSKGRTATTLAMFSLIIFTLVSTATITNTFSNFIDVESGSGGYDILAVSNPFNPISKETFSENVDQLVENGEIQQPDVIASAITAPVQAQSPTMNNFSNYVINGVDEEFLSSHNLELSAIAAGYDSTEQVWEALANNPSLVVIDNLSIDRTGDPTFQPNENAFMINSIKASDTTIEPVAIQVMGMDGDITELTVIGTLNTAPGFYGAMMNIESAQKLGYSEINRYYIRTTEGTDSQSIANAIERSFSSSGLQTTLLKEQLEQSRSTVTSIFYLIQGFIGLGLLIGIAALGVVTIRAVVERRQQIGVLRAIGFQQKMVQGIFLLESLFIAGLGTFIGYGLAITFAYNLYLQVAADQGLPFLPPWVVLVVIGVAILAASLFTAWLPSKSTSKVIIAEALRFE